MIGVEFVDGMGRIIKNGGRVMKNVTGYDLVKLMAGSYGTLGVLTGVSFKLRPAPETSTTLRFDLGLAEGLAQLRHAMASPYDVTGAVYTGNAAWLRIEGFADSVAYRAGMLGGDPVTGAASTAFWNDIRTIKPAAGHQTVWRISVKPSDAAQVAEHLHNLQFETPLLDWSGGLIWATGGDNSDAPRRITQRLGGHATLIRGSGHPVFHPEPAPLAAIATGLRAKFDPRGILNTGITG
jgi:glycolate oxidase FAD binding subunit